jgi:hypothetical protein
MVFLWKFWNHACSRFVEIKHQNENKRASNLSFKKIQQTCGFHETIDKEPWTLYTCKWFLGFIWLMLELVLAWFDKSLYCHES